MKTGTKIGIPLAIVPTATALAIAHWKKAKPLMAAQMIEIPEIAPVVGVEKSVSVESFVFPSEFNTGEKKSFTLRGHIDKGTVKGALALANDTGNPGNLYAIVGGKEFEVKPGEAVAAHQKEEHGPCTSFEMVKPTKAYFKTEGTYSIVGVAGYATDGGYEWTDFDKQTVTVKKAPLISKIPTWGWILGGTAAVGMVGMILTRRK